MHCELNLQKIQSNGNLCMISCKTQMNACTKTQMNACITDRIYIYTYLFLYSLASFLLCGCFYCSSQHLLEKRDAFVKTTKERTQGNAISFWFLSSLFIKSWKDDSTITLKYDDDDSVFAVEWFCIQFDIHKNG